MSLNKIYVMATTEINIPYKSLIPLNAKESSSVESKSLNLKANYSSIIKECAANSNLPDSLLNAFLVVLSNGKNNSGYKSKDGLIRMGVASLSQKTAKMILAFEKQNKRMNPAEESYLSGAEPKIGDYLSDNSSKNKTYSYDYQVDFNQGVNNISDSKNPFDLMKPEVSIQIAAIWLGQLWDLFATQTNKIIDKVLITALLPYNGWMAGNNFVKKNNWSIDYTSPQYIDKLPKPNNLASTSNIINPDGGWVGTSLRDVLASGGILDILK